MNEDEIRKSIMEGYINILKRDPDPEGLQTYINHIKNGMSIDIFQNALRISDEYRHRFGTYRSLSYINEWYDKIMFVSTWDIKCGIALYTRDLLEELEKLSPGFFTVRSIDRSNYTGAKLVHLQHEFSIMPKPPIVGGKVIITWHSIPRNMQETIQKFESSLEIVAHIVPCEAALEFINTSKDIYVVKLGSRPIWPIDKDDARKFLNIKTFKPIGFVFGFQSPNKNYHRLIDAAKNTDIHIIISGSTHFVGFRSNLTNNEYVTFLDRHLSEDEVDLYASASDLLLFDYIEQDHYSSSSALHRTIGSGRPVVCTNTKHFSDINGVPKFNNQRELEECIIYALKNQEKLGKYSLEYAKETSSENIAKKHIEIYKKYIDF